MSSQNKKSRQKAVPRAYSSFTRLGQIEKQKCKLQAARNRRADMQEKIEPQTSEIDILHAMSP